MVEESFSLCQSTSVTLLKAILIKNYLIRSLSQYLFALCFLITGIRLDQKYSPKSRSLPSVFSQIDNLISLAYSQGLRYINLDLIRSQNNLFYFYFQKSLIWLVTCFGSFISCIPWEKRVRKRHLSSISIGRNVFSLSEILLVFEIS